MKKLLTGSALLLLAACVAQNEPNPNLPLRLETAIDSDLLILKTEDIRIVEVKERKIAYEYNDQHIKLPQLGDHATRFCEGKGHDTILTDMKLTNREGFRRATFECREKPTLIKR
ncbi:MAG: hypothetical protein J5787_04690 [Alphaproteobacteria bacterium]|nr:hypothetical protein [Alphaproteobacteria bacterium]MBO4643058.1 hypothetical protein [Alphaproteobacteria bacterium]